MTLSTESQSLNTIIRITNILSDIGIKYFILQTSHNNDICWVKLKLNDFKETTIEGTGFSAQLAEANALSDLMIRLQARFIIRDYFMTKSYRQLSIDQFINRDEIDPNYNFSLKEYSYSDLYFIRSNFYDLIQQKSVNLPIKLINLLCNTNGLCSGKTREQAIVKGTCDLFKSMVTKLISTNKLAINRIDPTSLSQFNVYKKINRLKNLGLDVEILDLTDNRFPIVGLLVIDSQRFKYRLALGSDTNIQNALQSCYIDLFKGTNEDENFLDTMQQIEIGDNNSDPANQKISLCERLLLNKKTIDHLPYIFRNISNDVNSYQYILQIVRENNLDILVKDYSYLGFPTFRVYIPGISETIKCEKSYLFLIENKFSIINNVLNIRNSDEKKKLELLKKLIHISNNEEFRRQKFQYIFAKTYSRKDVDINEIYIDFLVAIIFASISRFKEAYSHYQRFTLENQIFDTEDDGTYELLKVLYLYFKYLAKGDTAKQIRSSLSHVVRKEANQYVYMLFQSNTILNILYWPSCPNCDVCKYKRDCYYPEWLSINQKLNRKLKLFIEKRKWNG